ncbi:ribosome biogenesis GTPase YlqF [Aliikangiella coralliicola]|uniref:Ribosome biogenesis GTPase A n=1 Tax=Aliikangiella coralliicola TaxID=2592383 RepID=A0A545U794_9GAMM|nr:ribosome biogenesis GTPase YlqF [Aliikangiella coralliicola]TQV85325.1 ribosome biogenesis GTPase YlqF [Aliikangiella coralliicola]
MTIQWYPGHMHKAQKEIKQALPKVDLIIEVLDARIPYSSANPVIAELSDFKGMIKPVIKIINKNDLADPEMTRRWCEYLELQQNTKALPLNGQQTAELSKITELARKLVPERVAREQPIKAMIMGIPNVGKSTIINGLSGRKIAKVGNEPAVTQRQQRIDLPSGLTLFDTPGILWPKIENQHSSYRLAICAAIKDTVLDYDEIAFYLVEYLIANYPSKLKEHYQLDELNQQTIDIIEMIGQRRGCLKAGGRIDLDKVSKIIINEFRNAILGQITLETPQMVEKELIEVAEKIRLKEEKQAARKKAGKKTGKKKR